MPDIFDQIAQPKQDIFDSIAKEVDIFDQIAPEKEGVYEGLVKPTAKAIPRVAGATAGSLAMFPVSGIGGLAKLISTGSLTEAEKTMREIQEVPSKLLIKTPEEQKAMENIGLAFKPFEMAGEGWRLIGEKTGIPYADPVLGTIGEASAIFGAGGRGVKKLVEKPAEIARGVSAKKVEALRRTQEKYGEFGTVPKELIVESAKAEIKPTPVMDVFDEITEKPPETPQIAPEGKVMEKGISTLEELPPIAEKGKQPWEMTREDISGKTVTVYHGAEQLPKKVKEYAGFGGFHVGSKKTALERNKVGEERMRVQYGKEVTYPIYEMQITPRNPYMPNGKILDERIPKDRTDLAVIQQLKSEREALRKQGYDVVPYINGVEGEGTLSYMILDENMSNRALSEGKPVPQEVLADYPDLAKQVISPEKAKGDFTLSFMGTQGAYEKVAKSIPRLKKMGQQLHDLVDVEAKWIRSGKPETGFHIKNIFSKRAVHEEFALNYARKVAKDVKYNQKELSRVALLAEQKIPKYSPEELNLKPAVDKVQKYFEAYRKEYAKRGVNIDFKERMINEIEELIGLAEKPSDIANLQEALKSAKQMSFVHIPSALWFRDFIGRDPAGAKSVLNLLVSQKRKSLNIQSLIDRGIIKPEDVNIVDIIASYGRRAGKDFAILDVVKSAEKEGLATKGMQEGFVVASHRAPILKGYNVHPLLADWIHEMTRPNVDMMNMFEKVISVTKMSAFYNPLFLPMYDTVQAAMLGSLRSPKTLKYMYQGVRDSYKKTPEYWQALDNGLASKPFNNPLTSYRRMTENAKHSQTGMIATRLLESLLPHKAIQNVYNASWHIAWELDKCVRQISYRYLIDKGYTPKEAAQLAAKFHSDYASVPPKTRKTLNHIFFTPTFKITMGKLYTEMISNAIKASGGRKMIDMYRGLAGKEKLGKMTPAQKKFAGGLVATVGILQAWDMYWKSQGFETDEWGRRYVKRVQTDEGEKELVMTWSNPANMFLKYGYRVNSAFQAGGEKPWVKLLMTNKWEFHPIWRTGYELINNDNGRGDKIYSEFEPDSEKLKKSAIYATTHIVALLGLMDKDPSDEEGRKQFKKEVGQLLDITTNPFTFKYMRSPEEKRKIYKIKSVIKRFRQEIFKQHRKPQKGELTPAEKYKILQEELRRIK